MKIDEAIEKYRNRVKQYKDWDNMKDIAEEHEQLAEWLELLKWYQQGMEDIPSESGVLPKDVYRAGYIKAIDDFEEKLSDECFEQSMTVVFEKRVKADVLTLDGLTEIIFEIAQQLKAGGTDA